MVTVAQHKGVQLLARFTLLSLHVVTRPGQIPHGFLLGIWNPGRRQVATACQARQFDGFTPIRLDPLTGAFGIREGATTWT